MSVKMCLGAGKPVCNDRKYPVLAPFPCLFIGANYFRNSRICFSMGHWFALIFSLMCSPILIGNPWEIFRHSGLVCTGRFQMTRRATTA